MLKKIGILFAAMTLCGADTFIEMIKKDWAIINYNEEIQEKGTNVFVGFLDSGFNLEQKSLANKDGKTEGSNTLSEYPSKASASAHGTHVAGIAIGNNYGSKVHGIAPQAGLYGLAYLNDDYPYDGTKDDIINFFKNGNVKIINNSWIRPYYPNINKEIKDGLTVEYAYLTWSSSPITPQFVFNEAKKDRGLQATIELAKDGILQVYSAGNEAQLSPSINASLPTYDESLKSWVSVSAIDSSYIENTGNKIILKEQTFGNLIVQGTITKSYAIDIRGGITSFGNTFKGSERYGILAPGYNIVSANAYYKNNIAKNWTGMEGTRYDSEFWLASGTSYSSPFVSGAAALVLEKYPFADGALLADILLSTANSNVELPKIIVQQTPTQWGTINKSDEKHSYYTIIYTDKNDKDKFSNKDQAKNYLIQELKMTEDVANEILEHLMSNNENSLAVYMTKEEIIGQGILDITKALKGLAKLDANRLLDSDVKKSLSNPSVNQAFYAVDTKGQNGTFENDISQVKWKAEWHNANALNAPKNLNGLDVGLIKTGAGTLTLSGTNNTYEGDTISSGGILKLTGTLTNSSVFAQNGGTFNLAGNGNVINNVTAMNNGRILLTSGEIGGSLNSKSGGIIEIESGKSATITGDVNNAGILKGVGIINGNVTNTGIIKAGFYDESIQTTIGQGDVLNINGSFTQTSADAQIQLAFTKNQSNTYNNSQLKAKSYNVTGGKLTFVPLHSIDSLLQDGDKLNITIDDELLANTTVSIQSRNLITFTLDKDNKTINYNDIEQNEETSGKEQESQNKGENVEQSASKENQGSSGNKPQNQSSRQTIIVVAKNTNDSSIKALLSVLSNKSASSATKSALAQLDNLAPSEFNEAINSIKDTPNSVNINTIDTLQKGLNIKSTLFLLDNFSGMGALNTSSVVFAPTAAFGDEYLGKVDDIYIKTQASTGIAYRRTNHDDYKQNMYMLDIQGKKQISDNSLLGGFIGYANAKTTKDYSEVRSNIFSLGLSYNHDFGSFGILGSTSAGMSFNNYDQSIKYISGSETSADYKNYFASFQIGAYKSFMMGENSSFAPLAMIDYSVIKQDSFDQNGALAKHYDSSTTNYSRTWLGMSFNHKLEFQNSWTLNSSLFAFYWHKLGNSDINQDLSFIESAGGKFDSKSTHEKQGFYGGIALEAKKNNKFFRVSFSDEKTSAYNQYEIMLRAGINF